MKALHLPLIFLGVSFTLPTLAILPLPYPIEPIDEEVIITQRTIPNRDPKSIEGYFELYSGSQLREMELPTFGNQPGALGYVTGETFTVPSELKNRVDFWKKIYSEYDSNQALLHDSDYPELSYGVLDISRYTKNQSLSYKKRMNAMNNYFKSEKDKITRQLIQLHNYRGAPEKMPVELFTLFKKFETIQERDKFFNAASRIRAQVGQRDHIVKGFLYGGRYFNQMMEIFAKKNIPKELTRLPLVESAFNLNARSKVGASGVWQFMRTTGKRYLRINRAIDERNDPITATWAAAELLRQNYNRLGSWPLAVTAYNHGREGMARAVRATGSESLHQIIKHYKASTFGFASSNFYSEFLAILEVEREYRKHFGKLMVDPPIDFEELTVVEESNLRELAEGCNMNTRELASFNPSLTDWVISGRGIIPQGYRLKVPSENKDRCRSARRTFSNLNRANVKQKVSFNFRAHRKNLRNP